MTDHLTYRAGETESFPGTHAITPEREVELRAHLRQCELPFLICADCAELYENIGYAAYAELIEQVEAEVGPTESEGYL